MELQMNRPLFRLALRRAATKARVRGKITGEERQLVLETLRRPTVETYEGPIDAVDGIQEMVESQAVAKAYVEGTPIRFDWFTIISIIIEMLPALLEWIKELLDKLRPPEEGEA